MGVEHRVDVHVRDRIAIGGQEGVALDVRQGLQDPPAGQAVEPDEDDRAKTGGQEARQEQVRDGMALVDGMGASRIAQELLALAGS